MQTRARLSADQVKAWAACRALYAVWLFLIDDDAVRTRWQESARFLSPWLMQPYARQPHITLAACGFLAPVATRDDEYSPNALEDHLNALASLPVAPFEVLVGGLNSFGNAPYLEVVDPGSQLEVLRRPLCAWTQAGKPLSFVPHITVGLYDDEIELELPRRAIEPLRKAPWLPVTIRQVTLAVYDPGQLGGPLTSIGHFTLPVKR